MKIDINTKDFGLVQCDQIEIHVKNFKLNNGNIRLIVRFFNGGLSCTNDTVSGNVEPLGLELVVPDNLKSFVTSDPTQIENFALSAMGATRK